MEPIPLQFFVVDTELRWVDDLRVQFSGSRVTTQIRSDVVDFREILKKVHSAPITCPPDAPADRVVVAIVYRKNQGHDRPADLVLHRQIAGEEELKLTEGATLPHQADTREQSATEA